MINNISFLDNDPIFIFISQNLDKLKEIEEACKSYYTELVTLENIINWLLQFRDIENIKLAFKILQRINFLNQETISNGIIAAIKKIPDNHIENPVFCPIGNIFDSSAMLVYPLTKLYGSKEEELSELWCSSCENLGNFCKKRLIGTKKEISSIILIDDNITSGTQLIDILTEMFNESLNKPREYIKNPLNNEEKKIISKIPIYFCVAIDLKDRDDSFLEKILTEFNINITIYSGMVDDQNYLHKGVIFDRDEDLNKIKKLISEISFSLFKDKNWDNPTVESRLFGYGNLGKLTVFSHNIPKSLIPILWKAGKYKDKFWYPIFPERREWLNYNEQLKQPFEFLDLTKSLLIESLKYEAREKNKDLLLILNEKKENLKSLEVSSDNAIFIDKYFEIIDLYIKLDDYSNAILELQQFESLVPENQKVIFQIKFKISILLINKGWYELALYELNKLLTISEEKSKPEVLYYKYFAYQFSSPNFRYSEIENAYLQLITHFENNEPEKDLINKIKFNLLSLYITFENASKAEEILNIIVEKTEDEKLLKKLFFLKISNLKAEYNNTINSYDEIMSILIDSFLICKMLIQISFAFFELENFERAISILKENCIPLAEKFNKQEELMIIYQNISFIEIDSGEAKWDANAKWTDLLDRTGQRYNNASIKSMYATENMLNDNFKESLNQLSQSQIIFDEMDCWQGNNRINKKYGELYLKTERYLLALLYFIRISDENKIQQVCDLIIKKVHTKEVDNFLLLYINAYQSLNTRTKIGFCIAIYSLCDILSNSLVNKLIPTLLTLSNERFSLQKNKDIKRPALRALDNLFAQIPNKFQKRVIERIFSIITSKEYISTKQIAIDTLYKLINNNMISDEETIFKKLFSQYKDELTLENHPLSYQNIANKIRFCLILILKKQQFKISESIKTFFYDNIDFRNLESIYINFLINKKLEPKVLNCFIKEIKLRIQNKINRTPIDIQNYCFEVINKKVLEKELTSIVKLMLQKIKGKNTSLCNKNILISLLKEINLPKSLYSETFKTLFKILKGKIQISDSEAFRQEIKKDPFSQSKFFETDESELISSSIFILSKFYKKLSKDEKKLLIDEIGKLSLFIDDNIRIACADSFEYLPLNQETILYYFSLLSDSNNKIVAYAINSLALRDINKISTEITINIIKRIIYVSEKYKEFVDVNTALAFAIRKILEKDNYKIQEFKPILTVKLAELKKNKFFTVRVEAKD